MSLRNAYQVQQIYQKQVEEALNPAHMFHLETLQVERLPVAVHSRIATVAGVQIPERNWYQEGDGGNVIFDIPTFEHDRHLSHRFMGGSGRRR